MDINEKKAYKIRIQNRIDDLYHQLQERVAIKGLILICQEIDLLEKLYTEIDVR
jgi:hypothetical protein